MTLIFEDKWIIFARNYKNECLFYQSGDFKGWKVDFHSATYYNKDTADELVKVLQNTFKDTRIQSYNIKVPLKWVEET